MNNQEIFDNMSKGEWIVGDSIGNGTRELAVWGENKRNPICLVSPKEKENETDLANAHVIAMMHRETISKGINPESVEKLAKAVETARINTNHPINHLPCHS